MIKFIAAKSTYSYLLLNIKSLNLKQAFQIIFYLNLFILEKNIWYKNQLFGQPNPRQRENVFLPGRSMEPSYVECSRTYKHRGFSSTTHSLTLKCPHQIRLKF